MNDEILQWLLEEENPSIRYATLTTLLGKNTDDSAVLSARNAIMERGTVRQLLDLQKPGGWWSNDPNEFYTDKYRGTVWNLIILAELGADASDEKVRDSCQFILSHSMELPSGGFSTAESRKTEHGLLNLVIPCLTGNMVYSLIKLGYGQDERVQKAIDWICTYQRTDDGDVKRPSGEMYDRYPYCWGAHSCHMGVVKALKALATIPIQERTDRINSKLDELVRYVLKHHVYKKSHDLSKVSKSGWLKFGFPLMYQTDVLELMDIMASLHVHSEALQEALDLIESKRTSDGTWKMQNSYNDRFLIPVETKSKPSKWVTLRALRVLKEYHKTSV
ncbi:MAG: nitrogen fixation protein NifH [Sphaerochaetaceae bacterium]